MIRGSGALLLNRHGQRFVDELERRDVVSTAINQFGSIGEEWKMTQENNLKNEVNNRIAILLMNQKVRSQLRLIFHLDMKYKILNRFLGQLYLGQLYLGQSCVYYRLPMFYQSILMRSLLTSNYCIILLF